MAALDCCERKIFPSEMHVLSMEKNAIKKKKDLLLRLKDCQAQRKKNSNLAWPVLPKSGGNTAEKTHKIRKHTGL